MKLVLLGAPGAGKGTLAQPLSKKLEIPAISTGEIFRQNIREKTELGKLASAYIEKGELVPDEVTISIVEDRIKQEDCKNGFILDGFPRTTVQAKAFDEILERRGEKIDAVLNINLADEVIISRLANRRVCEKCGQTYNTHYVMPKVNGTCDVCGGKVVQREDDREETVKARLSTYYTKTQPLVDYYEKAKVLIHIDNQNGTEESMKAILSELSKIK